MGPRLTRLRFGDAAYAVLSVPTRARPPRVPLTAAETQVLAFIVEGLTTAEIAKRRNVTRYTVGNQIAAVFRKLGVGSRAELMALLGRP